MSVGDAIAAFREETNTSQRELAHELHFHPTMISKVESGERKWPEAHDAKLAGLSWKMALILADERTGGYISNILGDRPNLDLHPAALKDCLMREMDELRVALEELIMARHLDPEKRKEQAGRLWQEIRDVEEKGSVLRGVLEDEFGLNRKELIQKHEQEVKRGER